MKEYPLFEQNACDLCPSARFVGGTSRWLCECEQPEYCRGVIYANKRAHICEQLSAGGIQYNRHHYMNGSVSHHDYYAQFVTPSSIDQVAHGIGKAKLSASKDPHLNDIPLKLWDSLHVTHRTQLLSLSNALGESTLTPTMSPAERVCLHKTAARLWVAENVPHVQHNVRVEYRDDKAESGSRLRCFETLIVGNIVSINHHYKTTSTWNDDPEFIKFLGAYITA